MDDHCDPAAPTSLPMLGGALALSGLLGVVTVAWLPAVSSEQWSYPFPVGVQWVVSILLAMTHLLSAAGFVGVARVVAPGGSGPAVATLRVPVVGFVVLSAELASGAIGGRSIDSGAAGAVGSVFGAGSVLTLIGGLVQGQSCSVAAPGHRWGPGPCSCRA